MKEHVCGQATLLWRKETGGVFISVDYPFSKVDNFRFDCCKGHFSGRGWNWPCGVLGEGGEEDYLFFLFNRKKKTSFFLNQIPPFLVFHPAKQQNFAARQLGEDALADKTYLFPKTLSATVTEINIVYSRQNNAQWLITTAWAPTVLTWHYIFPVFFPFLFLSCY